MIVREFIQKAYAWGPVLFGVGFIAPLLAQTMESASVSAPAGLTNIQFGLIVGVLAGSIAKLRGSWL